LLRAWSNLVNRNRCQLVECSLREFQRVPSLDLQRQ
jgi:hypothetical protein